MSATQESYFPGVAVRHHVAAASRDQASIGEFTVAPSVDSIIPTATGLAGAAAEAFTVACGSMVPLPTEGSAAWLVDDCLSCSMTCRSECFWAAVGCADEHDKRSWRWVEGYRRLSAVQADLAAGAVTLMQQLSVCVCQASETG